MQGVHVFGFNEMRRCQAYVQHQRLTLETQAHAGMHQTGRVGNINKQLAAIVIQGVSKETHWQRLSFVGIWRCETCPWLSLTASEEIPLQVFI